MIKKHLYIRLKELREANKLTQEDVATHLNISRQSVSQWEKGTSSPDIDNLVLLSKMYHITLDELVTGVEPKESTMETLKNNDETEKQKTFEFLCLIIILILSSQIALIGIIVSILVMLWIKKTQRTYKGIYLLCIISIAINIYNTYVLLDHTFFDFGQSYIEKIK